MDTRKRHNRPVSVMKHTAQHQAYLLCGRVDARVKEMAKKLIARQIERITVLSKHDTGEFLPCAAYPLSRPPLIATLIPLIFTFAWLDRIHTELHYIELC